MKSTPARMPMVSIKLCEMKMNTQIQGILSENV